MAKIRRKVLSCRTVSAIDRWHELTLACGHVRSWRPVNAKPPATSRCAQCERDKRDHVSLFKACPLRCECRGDLSRCPMLHP